MFWNDPNLYTATLPYKEFGTFPGFPGVIPNTFPGAFPPKEFGAMQTPFMPQLFTPWQNFPRFVPPTPFGILPYWDPRMLFNPYIQTQGFYPYVQPYNVNPLHRPFIY
jgi:hypothetical protein